MTKENNITTIETWDENDGLSHVIDSMLNAPGFKNACNKEAECSWILLIGNKDLAAGICSLPQLEQEILKLFFLDGLTLIDIASYPRLKTADNIFLPPAESYMRYIVKYSNSVIEKLHLQLKQAFKEGVRRGYIAEDLMSLHNIRRPKSNKPTKKVRGLTETEQQAFVKTLNDYPVPGHGQTYKKQLLIELYTGMRMGEINALSPEDIDFENGIIHVHKTISTGIGNRCFISDTTKTDAGNRYVPLNSLVRPVLEDAVKNMKKNPEGVIFYDCRKKKLVDTNQVCCYFNRVAKKSGLDITGQHCLRHTFATRCIEAGVSAVVLKTWLGHTDIHVTLDTYSDVFDRLNHKSVAQYEEYISKNL